MNFTFNTAMNLSLSHCFEPELQAVSSHVVSEQLAD
jgi:hypothetical protein